MKIAQFRFQIIYGGMITGWESDGYYYKPHIYILPSRGTDIKVHDSMRISEARQYYGQKIGIIKLSSSAGEQLDAGGVALHPCN